MQARQWAHICAFCALKHTRQNGVSGYGLLNASKMRYDCVSRQLVCSSCNINSILAVNLLGKIIRVGDTPFILSCCCASIIVYKGAGTEFSSTCGPHCTQPTPPRGKGRTIAVRVVAPRCAMCAQHGTVQQIEILDVATRSIQRVALCARHRVPDHLLRTTYDMRELSVVMALRSRSRPRSNNKKH